MKQIITIFMLLLPVIAGAQTTVLSKSFAYSGTNTAMANVSGFEGWTFNECNAINGKYMQVGTNSSLGSFCTPALGIYGNASLLIETTKVSSTAKFRVSIVDGGGTTSTKEYSVANDNGIHHPSAILIQNCTPSSRVKIEGTSGYFFVVTMKVFAIDDAFFYESFNYVNGKGGNDGSYVPDGTIIEKKDCSLFDNSLGASQQSVHLGNKCIYIASTHYTTPTMNIVPAEESILSFRVAGMNNYNFSLSMDVSCINGELSGISSVTVEHEKWNTYYIRVNNMGSSTQFSFNGVRCFLDDIKVSAVPSHFHESKDNMIYITANAGQTLDVPLIRTLTPNIWCPLCLPFDVTQSQMDVAMETTCELRTLTDIRNGVFIFDKASSVSAGTPFLVKVNTLVENPVFMGVTVVDTPAGTATGSAQGYSFVGTYSPVSLNTDGTHLFLDKQGNLCQPDSEEGYNRLNGLRAYFVVPDPSKARVFISDTTSEVSRINKTPAVHYDTYDLNGRHVEASNSKGLHIQNGRKFLNP